MSQIDSTFVTTLKTHAVILTNIRTNITKRQQNRQNKNKPTIQYWYVCMLFVYNGYKLHIIHIRWVNKCVDTQTYIHDDGRGSLLLLSDAQIYRHTHVLVCVDGYSNRQLDRTSMSHFYFLIILFFPQNWSRQGTHTHTNDVRLFTRQSWFEIVTSSTYSSVVY